MGISDTQTRGDFSDVARHERRAGELTAPDAALRAGVAGLKADERRGRHPRLAPLTVGLLALALFPAICIPAEALEPPPVIAPGTTNAPGPMLEASTVQFRWNPVENATGYLISVRDVTTDRLEMFEAPGGATVRPVTLILGDDYRWNMRAVSLTSTSEFSETLHFQIKLLPIKPTVTGVSPFPALAIDGPQVLTIHGANFARGCEVILRVRETGGVYPGRVPGFHRHRLLSITPDLSSTPGNWTVEVINPGGFTSGEFPFPCLPPERIAAWRWWRSGWPWACGGLAACCFLSLGWWRTARCRLPQALATERTRTRREERDRLVRDLHDRASADVSHLAQLADLTLSESAALPSATQDRLRELHAGARDAETAIGDLLWAADAQNERLPQLAARLRVRIRERLQPHGVEPDFTSWPAPVPALALSAAVSGQLLHLSHEVLNNVVKHAQATKLVCTLTLADGAFVLGFQDNGRGFRPDALPAGRRGLANLRSRVQTLGGTLQIQSAPGAGTEITVRLPLEQNATDPP